MPGNAAGDVIGLTNNITAARTVTIDTTSRTVGALNIGDSNNTHVFTLAASGGAGLTFNNGGSGVALTEFGTIQDTVSTPVTLADNLTVNVGGQLSISGPISESGGSRSLTKSGLGYLTLGGNNTYAGDTTVTGRLTVAANNALGTTDGATIVSTGGQVRINNLVTVSGERLTLSGTGEGTSEGALRIASGTATWGGTVTLAANATVLAGGGNLLKIGPGSGTAINLQGNTLDYAGAGGHEVLGGVFGTGGIAKRGSGPLTLSGSGSYSGATTIADGKIVANATSALGSSPVTVAAGKSLELKGGFDVGGGQLTLNGDSLTNVSGNNTYSGPVTAAASSRIFVTSGTLTLSNTIGQSSPSNAITFSGDGVTLISGNLGAGLPSLDINGKASDVPTVILTGSNANFTGTVGVQKGTLQLGDGGTTGSLPVSGAFNIGSGARVIVKQSDTVTQGTDFSGTLNGLGGFIQAGSGTTILNFANSYTGTTNVDAGTLIINGNQAAATGAVTVANGATLGGSGTIGGAVIVNGILSPGNSPGLLTVGSLDLRAGSTTLMQIIGTGNLAGTAGTDYDRLVISTAGGLGYGGTLDLDFANTTTFADGTTFDLFGFTGSTLGRFGSVSSTGSGSYGGLTFSGVDGVWTALFGSQQLTFSELTGQLRFTTNSVPEIDPATGSSALSLIAGVVALIEQRRRRAKVVA
ncbi:MAG: autotransporter-associated beta strand repeat-containing protein [Planctomycetota bacterium]|nr:autotransporter-associated beta strand repeat-containing protein [Planctomycetota bacterium]